MSVSTPDAPLFGGIDLGGTKIEATLYDASLNPITSRRIATPRDSYANLLTALTEECAFLEQAAAPASLQIGIGIPGVIDPETGRALTANLPATGHRLAADLQAATAIPLTIANDCKCFALSEAKGGAGQGAHTVFGLVLGTGVAGGFCLDGQLQQGATGYGGEVGHFAIPATLAIELNLPLLPCGCGRTGCYETLASGPGISALHHKRTGQTLTAREVSTAETDAARRTMADWHKLVAELIWTIQLTLDPDCIVLGGGLSRIAGLAETLRPALAATAISGARSPQILPPLHGDSSGTRGAAMLAATGLNALP